MLKSIFAAIAIVLASIFGGHHIDVTATAPSQPAAAASAYVAATIDPFGTYAATSSDLAIKTTTPVASSTVIIKNYITQPVIERIVQSPPMSGAVLGAATSSVTLADLQKQIEDLHTQLYGNASGAAGGGLFGALALSQIGSNSTISGATITVSP
jgi:hypothetical protein